MPKYMIDFTVELHYAVLVEAPSPEAAKEWRDEQDLGSVEGYVFEPNDTFFEPGCIEDVTSQCGSYAPAIKVGEDGVPLK